MTTLSDLINQQTALVDDVAAGNDGVITDFLNAKTISVARSISRGQFAIWCASTGLRAKIQDYATSTNNPLRSSALALLDFLQGGVSESLDLTNPAVQTMLAAWVQAGDLTQAQSDELYALGTVLTSLAEQSIGRAVTAQDVANALRG